MTPGTGLSTTGAALAEAPKGKQLMKIYRRVIPKISKDVVRSLLAKRAIEIEDGHRDEAELDVAAVLVEYLNRIDQLNADAEDALQRHSLGAHMLGQVKKTLAGKRNIQMGEDAKDFIINSIIESLFDSKHITEVFEDDNELRLSVDAAMDKYLGVDEELDREVRNRLKNLREGTAEWEAEYSRLINHMRGQKQDAVS